MAAKINPVRLLRLTGLWEAVSYMVLFFIAMPMKYFAGMPGAIRVPGMIHGVLFIAFCLALLWAWRAARWPLGRAAVIFGAALVPFGPFLLERRMKRYEAEYRPLSESGASEGRDAPAC